MKVVRMIAATPISESVEFCQEVLVRVGLYGEPLRCRAPMNLTLSRRVPVVIGLERGPMLAEVLQILQQRVELNGESGGVADYVPVLRLATGDDLAEGEQLKRRANGEFSDWQARLADWQVNLELVDLEWTLDGRRLMLYVLNDRGPETTKLALQAAAAGFSYLDVLPVSAEGLAGATAASSSGGGCGSGGGGCGSGGGGCKH